MVVPRSIGGGVILIVAAATAIGRSANILALLGSNERRKAASISAVNTLQSTLKVIWKARWKRASELRVRSSRLCAKSQSSLSNRRACKAHAVRLVRKSGIQQTKEIPSWFHAFMRDMLSHGFFDS